ncbi:PREDICTED: gap junction delta-3 protein [Thamnophis sirtalis]|uniref:Gap junction delta-3 protein n=1 Tax=Thamnophis sirtalis TaxID=35019 RepID=A0A6I9YY33_9SAUR|nr:PREDICTED: gap junction delta-3 protein [Thamnophis sirtalis]XP_032093587.1 gap junction delta-3 protein [Thamnophis elegans]XP_032093588.1 gap junction delta-3 protein [Thamnophis elegans]XP_032093589.1 gap junction delta-3 protein [Thamnophis elegans]
MGEWGFLSSLLDAVQEHSPMVGRFWLVVMLIFRILILATVGSDVFDDEQEEFECNTKQVGCKQICYDLAFPISHYRFWVFHIVVLSAPAVMFVIYSMHQTTKINRGLKEIEGNQEEANQTGRKVQEQFELQPSQRTRNIQTFYIVNVIVRILAEMGFLVGQWMLYGFQVGYQYICKHRMCPHLIDCFVSRPTEKTIFIQFYFMVGLVSAFLSLAELAHLLLKKRCQRRRVIAPPAIASYEQQDNWSNQKQEKSQHFLAPPDGGTKGTSSQDGIPNHYESKAHFHHKNSIKSSRSSRSSARGDLTV